MSQVYVMDNGRYRKIGFSEKPAARAKQVRQGLPIAVVHTVETGFPRAVERAAHDILRSHRVSREWFDVSIEVAIEAVNAALHCHGSEHVVFKAIRFSAQQAARLDAARARMGGTYADVIDAALRLWEGQSHPSNAELIAMLEARLNGKG